MTRNVGYATQDATSPLTRYPFNRRTTGDEDVRIRITTAGSAVPTCTRHDEFSGALAPL